MQNSINAIKDPNTTTSLLEEIFNALASAESSKEDLRTTLNPILLKNNSTCGESSDSCVEQSPLNLQLCKILTLVQNLNMDLIDLRSEVTL